MRTRWERRLLLGSLGRRPGPARTTRAAVRGGGRSGSAERSGGTCVEGAGAVNVMGELLEDGRTLDKCKGAASALGSRVGRL